MKRWSIKDIQSLTEEEAKNLSEEQIEYKGHNLYFVDFGGNFGYSMLIFLNGGHLHYANDYALHHEEQKDDHAALKEIYINGAKEKLFSGTDFSEVKNYIDYKRKCYYLCNYYIQQIPQEYISYVFYMESKKNYV